MDIKEFAQKILSVDDLAFINYEIDKYFTYFENQILENCLFSNKNIAKKEKETEILDFIHLYFPNLMNNNLTLMENKGLHAILYSKDRILVDCNTVVYNENIIIKKEILLTYNYLFFPRKDELYIKYDYSQEENAHTQFDEQIKLDQYPKYQKLNHLIYVLQKVIKSNIKHKYYENTSLYEEVLNKAFAMAILNKTEPMDILKDRILHVKDIMKFEKINSKELERHFKIIES